MRARRLGAFGAAATAALSVGGCGVPLLNSSSAPVPVAAGTSPRPSASSWYTSNKPVAASVAPAQATPGALAPSPTPTTGFLALPSAPAAHPAAGTATHAAAAGGTATCGFGLGAATVRSIPATPAGKGAATVQWLDTGDSSIVMYRLGALAQGFTTVVHPAPASAPSSAPLITQPSPKWQSVAASHSCRMLSATVTGLTSAMSYQFWLDAVHTTAGAYALPSATQETMIGRSPVITIR
ncbi:hypothetical protein [Actinoplanes sp. NPDC049681]|uniref:hypothetical protein n=1 Tax=Actinoplanes sp. NPDC049681 TaxID=3363905 RepID=UPI00379BAC04